MIKKMTPVVKYHFINLFAPRIHIFFIISRIWNILESMLSSAIWTTSTAIMGSIIMMYTIASISAEESDGNASVK